MAGWSCAIHSAGLLHADGVLCFRYAVHEYSRSRPARNEFVAVAAVSKWIYDRHRVGAFVHHLSRRKIVGILTPIKNECGPSDSSRSCHRRGGGRLACALAFQKTEELGLRRGMLPAESFQKIAEISGLSGSSPLGFGVGFADKSVRTARAGFALMRDLSGPFLTGTALAKSGKVRLCVRLPSVH